VLHGYFLQNVSHKLTLFSFLSFVSCGLFVLFVARADTNSWNCWWWSSSAWRWTDGKAAEWVGHCSAELPCVRWNAYWTDSRAGTAWWLGLDAGLLSVLSVYRHVVHKSINCFAHRSGCEMLWWVCLSVCLSVHKDITRTTCTIFTKFFVHVGHVCGWVLLQHVGDRPHHLSVGRSWRECTARVKCNLWLPC